ncbi:MAG: nucleotidyl transferase [Ardenticatenia bacterium]|nr:MAG: nucleotidyl transferase [Ardenticatenia bacterium]
MQAVIMAGGEGSRLRPLTINRPKPMVPLVNKPMLGHIFDLCKRHGITDLVLTVQYMAHYIQDYYGDGSEFGLNIRYSVEDVPLGTAGSVRQAAELLNPNEPFIVLSGDALTDFDLSAIIEFHRRKGGLATVTLTRVSNPLEYGIVITDEEDRITRFIEKPGWADVVSDTVNTGIYVLEPEVLNFIEKGSVFDFSHDLFPLLIERGTPPYGYIAEGYWTDIGNPQAYVRATQDVLEGRVKVEPLGIPLCEGIYTGGEVEIAPDARLVGPIYLGEGVKLKGGVVIEGPAVIRDGTVIDARSTIERSIIWRNSYIGERTEIRGAIILRQCSIKSRVIIFEGAIISDNVHIEEDAIIQPNVKIWPDKEVEAGAVVSASIIWGSRGRRTLFGRYGVTGIVNVDITPEFAAKLGGAFGATLPRGASVVLNREAHNTPRVIKRALLSGLPSAGVHALDIQTQPIPVARYYTRTSHAQGGIHVRLSPYDNRVVDIKFFDANGLDLGHRHERNVETVFHREDIRRAYLDEIGRIDYATDVQARYAYHFLNSLDQDLWPLPNAFGQVVIDYANAVSTQVLPPLLTELNVDVVAVNADIDERKLFRTREQFAQGMNRLAAITTSLGINFGARLDVGGERIFITVDNRGRVSDMDAFLAITKLAFMVWKGCTVGIPNTAPRAFERIAEEMGGHVRRLKSDPQSLMRAAESGQFALIGDGGGGFIFPGFTPFVDGMFAIAKIMELSALAECRLGEIVRELPAYHMAHGRVPCPWEHKGALMRQLIERYGDQPRVEVPEGVRIDLGDEWVLIIPDADAPAVRIIAEGRTAQNAHELVDRYVALVNNLLLTVA